MKAINDKDLKIKICELMIACCSDNFEDAYKTKADLFLWIEKVCHDRDDALREADYLKKYGSEVPDIRDMYPDMESRLDPADYADLPFPKVNDVEPAEEVEGANE